MGPVIRGALTTRLSSTNAARLPTFALVYLPQMSLPVEVKVSCTY